MSTESLKRFHATVLINLTRGLRSALPDRDLFVSLPETTSFVVDAADENAAVEWIFAVGNRIRADVNGKMWSPHVRSMSVGDVVIIHEEMGKGAWYSCEPDGWKDVTDYILNWISGTPMAYQLAKRFHAARFPLPEMFPETAFDPS